MNLEAYPILYKDECMESLGNAPIFLTSDTNSSYCQVEIANEDSNKTAHISDLGLFRFEHIQFRIKTAQG